MTLDPNRTVNVAIQVVPITADPIPAIDEAIATIATFGISFEVGPLETTMEGRLEELLEVARHAHLAALKSASGPVLTFLKIADHPGGTTIAENVEKHRRGAPRE